MVELTRVHRRVQAIRPVTPFRRELRRRDALLDSHGYAAVVPEGQARANSAKSLPVVARRSAEQKLPPCVSVNVSEAAGPMTRRSHQFAKSPSGIGGRS